MLLAGGQGRRLGGGDKPLRQLGGKPLLAHVIARIEPQVSALALNANGDPARFAAWGLPVLADPLPGYPGPLAGVLAGMRWAAGLGATDLVSVPTDTPFLPTDLVERLLAARRGTGLPIACAASLGRLHPTVALWSVSLADALERALGAGVRKVGAWTAAHGVAPATFAAAPHDPLFNVNDPDDLAAAAGMLESRLS